MGRGKQSPMSVAQGAMHQAKRAVQMSEQVQGLALEAYRSHQQSQAYVERLETSLTRMMEANAVAYRLLFQTNGITLEDRKYASAELDSLKEFFALLSLVATVRDTDSPLLMFDEIVNNLPLLPSEESARRAILVEFKHPEDPADEETPAVTLILDNDGESSLIDGYPGEDIELSASVTIQPEVFDDVLKKKTSVEVAFMDGHAMVDHPFELIAFEEMYDIRTYIEEFQAKEKDRQPEPLEEGQQMEVNPDDFAHDGHPEEALMFGGDYGRGPE